MVGHHDPVRHLYGPVFPEHLLHEKPTSSRFVKPCDGGFPLGVEELGRLADASVDHQGPFALMGSEHPGPPTLERCLQSVQHGIRIHVNEYAIEADRWSRMMHEPVGPDH